MTMIYATPFRESDKETTGPSVDSGFQSIDEVVQCLGDGYRVRRPALIIYGSGDGSILYSRAPFRIDRPVSNG
jgi:hypothetical protein